MMINPRQSQSKKYSRLLGRLLTLIEKLELKPRTNSSITFTNDSTVKTTPTEDKVWSYKKNCKVVSSIRTSKISCRAGTSVFPTSSRTFAEILYII